MGQKKQRHQGSAPAHPGASKNKKTLDTFFLSDYFKKQLRSVVFDSGAASDVTDLTLAEAEERGGFKWHGLLIGQGLEPSSDSSVVAFAAETPEPSHQDLAPGQLEAGPAPSFDVDWLLEHWEQVTNMLPGGLEVLGVLLVDLDPESHPVTRAGLDKLAKRIAGRTPFAVMVVDSKVPGEAKVQRWSSAQGSSGGPWAPISLTLDEASQRQDFADLCQWILVRSSFILDEPVAFESRGPEDELDLEGKVDVALGLLEAKVRNSVILFDGTYVGDHQPLIQKKPDPDDEDEGLWEHPRTVKADILLDTVGVHRHLTATADGSGSAAAADDRSLGVTAGSRLKLGGKISVVALVHPEATAGEAAAAVKEDVMRSMRSRLKMHYHSLVGEEAEGPQDEGVMVHEPPRRVLVNLPQWPDKAEEEGRVATELPAQPPMVSDYLFPGQLSYETVTSVAEVFGFEPELDQIDDELETVVLEASAAQVRRSDDGQAGPTTSGNRSPEAAAAQGLKAENSRRPLWAAATVVVALVATLVSYYYSMVEDPQPTSANFDE